MLVSCLGIVEGRLPEYTIFDIPSEKLVAGAQVWRSRWPWDRTTPTDPTAFDLLIWMLALKKTRGDANPLKHIGNEYWCAVSRRYIIVPNVFANESVTVESINKIDCHFPSPELREYAQDVIFQPDGAPPHFAILLRHNLDRKLRSRWTSRGSPFSCPPRSLDSDPVTLFLWMNIKNLVFG